MNLRHLTSYQAPEDAETEQKHDPGRPKLGSKTHSHCSFNMNRSRGQSLTDGRSVFLVECTTFFGSHLYKPGRRTVQKLHRGRTCRQIAPLGLPGTCGRPVPLSSVTVLESVATRMVLMVIKLAASGFVSSLPYYISGSTQFRLSSIGSPLLRGTPKPKCDDRHGVLLRQTRDRPSSVVSAAGSGKH